MEYQNSTNKLRPNKIHLLCLAVCLKYVKQYCRTKMNNHVHDDNRRIEMLFSLSDKTSKTLLKSYKI